MQLAIWSQLQEAFSTNLSKYGLESASLTVALLESSSGEFAIQIGWSMLVLGKSCSEVSKS